jgi:hypothetical protein
MQAPQLDVYGQPMPRPYAPQVPPPAWGSYGPGYGPAPQAAASTAAPTSASVPAAAAEPAAPAPKRAAGSRRARRGDDGDSNNGDAEALPPVRRGAAPATASASAAAGAKDRQRKRRAPVGGDVDDGDGDNDLGDINDDDLGDEDAPVSAPVLHTDPRAFLRPPPYNSDGMYGPPPPNCEYDELGQPRPAGQGFTQALAAARSAMQAANDKLVAEAKEAAAARAQARQAVRARKQHMRQRAAAALREAEAAINAAVEAKTGLRPRKAVPDSKANIAYPRTPTPVFQFSYEPLSVLAARRAAAAAGGVGPAGAGSGAAAAAPAATSGGGLGLRRRMGLPGPAKPAAAAATAAPAAAAAGAPPAPAPAALVSQLPRAASDFGLALALFMREAVDAEAAATREAFTQAPYIAVGVAAVGEKITRAVSTSFARDRGEFFPRHPSAAGAVAAAGEEVAVMVPNPRNDALRRRAAALEAAIARLEAEEARWAATKAGAAGAAEAAAAAAAARTEAVYNEEFKAVVQALPAAARTALTGPGASGADEIKREGADAVSGADADGGCDPVAAAVAAYSAASVEAGVAIERAGELAAFTSTADEYRKRVARTVTVGAQPPASAAEVKSSIATLLGHGKGR